MNYHYKPVRGRQFKIPLKGSFSTAEDALIWVIENMEGRVKNGDMILSQKLFVEARKRWGNCSLKNGVVGVLIDRPGWGIDWKNEDDYYKEGVKIHNLF